MARKKATANAKPEVAERAHAEPTETSDLPSSPTFEPGSESADQPPVHAPDPSAKISVSLSAYRGGPSMHLLRSQKFNQMQVRFKGEQPAEQYLAMLAHVGWKDRTETEGVWTKQIDRNRRWQSVQQMENEFREIANAIRRDKGLSPALQGMAVG